MSTMNDPVQAHEDEPDVEGHIDTLQDTLQDPVQ